MSYRDWPAVEQVDGIIRALESMQRSRQRQGLPTDSVLDELLSLARAVRKLEDERTQTN